MVRAIELLAVIQFTLIGLSHIVQRHAWVDFFLWLGAKGRVGALANGFFSLAMGSLIVAFHPVWSGVPVVLTIFGVLNLVKAAQCFLLPDVALRSMQRVSHERAREFVAAGVAMLVVAGVTVAGMM
jgi:hypothetical protein